MKTKLGIKNFRVFDENGVTLELNPITILTGANSSGKSSIVKAILLLDSFLKQVKNDVVNGQLITLKNYKLDFYRYPISTLGKFDTVVHAGSPNRTITIEYETYSLMISETVFVRLIFSSDENDVLNNGYLHNITLSTSEGCFFSSDRTEGNKCNLNIIKDAGIDFLLFEYIIWQTSVECSKANYKSLMKVVDYEIKKSASNNVKQYIGSHFEQGDYKKPIIIQHQQKPDIVSWTKKNTSLYYIPVLKIIDQIKKEDILKWAEENLLQNSSRKEQIFTKRILKDFVTSEFSLFSDYFAKNESLHLDNFAIRIPIDLSDIVLSRFSLRTSEENDEIVLNNTEIDFEEFYDVIMKWNRNIIKDDNTDNPFYTYSEHVFGRSGAVANHFINDLLYSFVSKLIEESLCPDWCGKIKYVSSAQAEIKRLYTLETKDLFSESIEEYLELMRVNNPSKGYYKRYESDKFINRWLGKKGFNIGKYLSVSPLEEGIGVQLRLHKTRQDKKGCLLADEGYGITQLISILLQVANAILSAADETFYNEEDSPTFHYQNRTIAIEEPEIRLHPNYQSKLADLFLEAYEKYNIHFIIETHSEYLIRKSQVLVSKMGFQSNLESDSNSPFRTYYVPEDGKPYSLGYRKDGKFAEDFGSGFYDEAINQTIKLLQS